MNHYKDINDLIHHAEQGDGTAQGKLANCYFYGTHGVEQNYEKTVKYFTAAEDWDMLGICYLHGFGVERNAEQTIALWETACEDGQNYELMFRLAHLYGDGIEIDPDYQKAFYWYSQLAAIDDGDLYFPQAAYQLSCHYYEGKGVRRNLKKALTGFKYTLNLFYRERCNLSQDPHVWYWVYDPAIYSYQMHNEALLRENKFSLPISEEPDFIIHTRKVLIEHGAKMMLKEVKKAAEKGDVKAGEILTELGIEFTVQIQPEPIPEKPQEETHLEEETTVIELIDIAYGDKVSHVSYGNGYICNTDGRYFRAHFTSVGTKTFLNPDAFTKGFLTLL